MTWKIKVKSLNSYVILEQPSFFKEHIGKHYECGTTNLEFCSQTCPAFEMDRYVFLQGDDPELDDRVVNVHTSENLYKIFKSMKEFDRLILTGERILLDV